MGNHVCILLGMVEARSVNVKNTQVIISKNEVVVKNVADNTERKQIAREEAIFL